MSVETEKKQKEISEQIISKVDLLRGSGEISIKPRYAPENHIKSALMILSETMNKDNRPVLVACSKASIQQALFKMIVEGLSPTKGQCSFVAYGDNLTMQREYPGNIKLAKEAGLKTVTPQVIYQGDDIKFKINNETGKLELVYHVRELDNMDITQIKGAYATTIMKDGEKNVELMNMPMIKAAWNQGKMKGNSPAHKNFTDQMVCKTVINRACKLIIRSSDDSFLLDVDNVEEAEHEELKQENEAKNSEPERYVNDEISQENNETEQLPEYEGNDKVNFTQPEPEKANGKGKPGEDKGENEQIGLGF